VLKYIIKRVALMLPMLLLASVVSFVIIQLPPGDFLTTRIHQLQETGEPDETIRAEVDYLRERYGLGEPIYVQYYKWIRGIITRGDFGDSFYWKQPVAGLIWGRLGSTMLLSLVTTLFVWIVAFPIGIYSAVNRYSVGDYLFTFFGFLGRSIPDFMLALVLLYIMFSQFGQSAGGLFSSEFENAPWSMAKVVDLLKHIWIPILILGSGGTAGLIRTMRANVLDELHKPYVMTARAKGLPEKRLLIKYPVRVALNPFISNLAWFFPNLVSSSMIVSVVLNLPTTGPLLLTALQFQDMYLAGSLILMVSVLTLLGTLISDILLALADPRIRLD